MQTTFNMMVIDHFGYLVSEYRFWIGKILDHDPDIMLEGFVEFQFPTTFVSVAGEWYATVVTFGRAWMIGNLRFLLNWSMSFYPLLLSSERSFVAWIPGGKRKPGS